MAVRKAEVLFVGDAASIVRAAKQAELATAQTAAAAKKAAAETATANKAAGDSATASAAKQEAAHKRAAVSIAGVGSAMSKMTFPILAVAGASAKMAMDFQASTTKLRTQAGATQQQMESLRKGILNMAGSVGTGPNALSAGMYHVVSSMNAILPPAQRVSGELIVLKDAARLAQVGGANLEETTYALASAMNALHAPISETAKVTGELNAIVGAGDMIMQDLIDSFQSGVVPAAREAGLSLQSLGAPMAVMGDMGMRGAIAGTRLRMSIALLSSPSAAAAKVLDTLGMSSKQATSTSAAMAAALEKAGLRTTTLGADLRKPDGFMVALKDLNDHLRASGLTATGAAAVMNKAFGGGKMGATINLLAQNTDRLKLKFDQIGQSTGQFGADWKATTETAAFKWHAMIATVQADGIKLGNAVLPVVLGVGNQVMKVVSSVSSAFQALPKGLQSSIITGGLMVAAVGPALKLVSIFTSGIGKLLDVAKLATGTRLLGGAGGVGGVAAGAEGAAASSGLMGGLRGLGSRAVGGLAIGGMGVVISQAVGDAVHGGVGSAVKAIGTDASIGAGMGAIFGPAGIAGGAIIGGLVGTFTHFDRSYGATIGGKLFAGGFGGAAADSLAKQTAQALDQLHTLTTGHAQVRAVGRGGVQNVGNVRVSMDQLTGDALLKAEAAATKAGNLVAKSLEAGWNQYKFQSEPIMFGQLKSKLAELPPAAQAAAAQSAILFASKLEEKGKLAKGATERMLNSIEVQFPAFSQYLGLTAGAGLKQFTAAMDLRKVEQNTKSSLDKMRADFPQVTQAMDSTSGDVESKAAAVVRALQKVQRDGTGPMRAQATADMAKTRTSITADMTQMAAVTLTKSQALAAAVKAGSSQAAKSAQTNMQSFAQHVNDAMSNGLTSTGQGMQLIIATLNKALKEMGQKTLTPIQVGAMTLNAGKTQQLLGHAGGGLVQFGNAGDRGRDNIPVDFGGNRIAVGSGEIGAVFNHTQQKVANSLLSPVGGLPGLFNNFTRPHYMASGGMVGNSVGAMTAEANAINAKHYPYVWGGGHNSSFSGPYDCSGSVSAVLHAAGLLKSPEMSGQLASFGLPGPGAVTVYANPVHTFMSIMGKFFGTHGSSGAGWYSGSAMPGFAVRHAPVSGGEIMAPHVAGTGVMATLAKSSLGMAAKGANAMLAKVLSSIVGGGQFGGGDWGTFGSGGAPSANRTLGQKMMLAMGWPMGEWPSLNALWTQESGWNSAARNRSSGAAGIPQDITGNMHGGAKGQIAWGLNYIKGRYGNPDSAEAHEKAYGWYAKGGLLPFVGSFRKGGTVPHTGLAHVHQGETVVPAGQAKNSILTAAAAFLFPLDAAISLLASKIAAMTASGAPNHNSEIAKLTDELAKIRKERINPPKAHNASAITALQSQLDTVRREKINGSSAAAIAQLEHQRLGLPTPAAGKAGDAQRTANAKERAVIEQKIVSVRASGAVRGKALANETLTLEEKIKALKAGDSNSAATRRKALANETLTIEEKIKELKEKDKSAKTSLADTLRGLNLQSKNLTQLKTYTDAITGLKTQMVGLAQQAAQAWAQVQTTRINAAHEAAIAAIGTGPQSTQLAGMQAQDKVDQAERQLDSLNKSLIAAQKQQATDQKLADHSGGQTHLDALAAVENDKQTVQDAQQAITDFMRSQDEQRLQDQIASATTAADSTQQIALGALTQQTVDYQAGLDAQFGALTDSLNKRKITYAQWAVDVNGILAPYGLSAATDPTTEQTVTTGPGPGLTSQQVKFINAGTHKKGTGGLTGIQRKYRASGGPVQPGYVYRVGEQGPEDVMFGRPGTVLNASQTRQGNGGGGVHIHGDLIVKNQHDVNRLADRLAFRAQIGVA